MNDESPTPMTARYPGTCARTGRDFPAGTPIIPYGKKWQIAPGSEGSVPVGYEKPDEDHRPLRFGQLWEPCSCGEEPVCVNCFRCARHCRC